jgi:hypothetical protein
MNANQAIRSFFRGVVNSQPEPPIPPNLSISIPSEDADEGQSLGRVDGFGQDEACDERDEGSKVSLCLLAA